VPSLNYARICPQRLAPFQAKEDKSLEEFEKFLKTLELRLVDRKGTVWLVKLECRLSEEDRKRLLGLVGEQKKKE
jgi:hypothetical protein